MRTTIDLRDGLLQEVREEVRVTAHLWARP